MANDEDRIYIGAMVRTLDDDDSRDWNAEGRIERESVPRGIWGYVVDVSDRHGLCYRVWHVEQGLKAWYNPGELEVHPRSKWPR